MENFQCCLIIDNLPVGLPSLSSAERRYRKFLRHNHEL